MLPTYKKVLTHMKYEMNTVRLRGKGIPRLRRGGSSIRILTEIERRARQRDMNTSTSHFNSQTEVLGWAGST